MNNYGMGNRSFGLRSIQKCSLFLRNSSLLIPLFLSRNFFNSGIDDRRVQRLRRSGMTFNKPRGRDTLSCSFHARIRLQPLTGITDLYNPSSSAILEGSDSVEGTQMTGRLPARTFPLTPDPWSSTGNLVRLRHAAEGDSRSQKIIKARAIEEKLARKRANRHIAVVDLLPSSGMCFKATQHVTQMLNSSFGNSEPSSAESCYVEQPSQPSENAFPAASADSRGGQCLQSDSLRDVLGDSNYAKLSKVATLSSSFSSPGAGTITHTINFFPPPIFFPQPHPQYYVSFRKDVAQKRSHHEEQRGATGRCVSRDEAPKYSSVAPSSSSFGGRENLSSSVERVDFELPAWSINRNPHYLGKLAGNVISRNHVSQEISSAREGSKNSDVGDNKEAHLRTKGEGEDPREGIDSLPSAINSRNFIPLSLNLLPTTQRHNLQKSCDATLLPVCWTRQVRKANPNNSEAVPEKETVSEHFYLISCIEPSIEKREYGREEAQVEMITAYRNILLECAEVLQHQSHENYPEAEAGRWESLSQKHCAKTQAKQKESSMQEKIDILRVPALCVDPEYCEFHNDNERKSDEHVSFFHHEIGKLNHEALLKGFHRLPVEYKESLLCNPAFVVELFVPLPWFEHFAKAFHSEAWEVPSSTLRPARTALYPGLAPPLSLLAMDGWLGKRPELEAAGSSKGNFLLKGPFYQLDGKPVEQKEVWTDIRVFGSKDEENERIKKEQESFGSTKK